MRHVFRVTPSSRSRLCPPPQAASEEEREHAELLMEYQNVRGGRVRLASMLQPETEFDHSDKVRAAGRRSKAAVHGEVMGSSALFRTPGLHPTPA